MSKVKQKNLIIIVAVAAILALVIYMMTKSSGVGLRQKNVESVDEATQNQLAREVEVNLTNGQPVSSKLEFNHSENAILVVKGVDRDYNFELAPLGMNETIPQGNTLKVYVRSLGSGVHTFNCGSGCSGDITILTLLDVEDSQ